MQIEKKNVAELLPADYNPRKDLKPGDPEYEKLKRSIEQFGYVEPVIWNATTGCVVGGHQRLKVLQDMGMTEVDCVVVELDVEHEKALNVALNKISGEWDNDKLALLIADLQGADFDVSLTGFEPAELDDLFKDSTKYNIKEYDFDVAADMVRMCPALNKRVKILASQKRIVYQPTNSFYQVLSAEAYSKHGFNIHGVVFDELHTQPNRKLFDVMTKGSGDARMQPLYFLITTAGTDTNSICYETHQKAKDILEGRKIDPTFYPVIYGADESDDWTDPKVWKKANPSLGITVGIDKVKAACESAKQNPGEENSFRQLRLNQWVKQAVRWMPMEKWDNCSFRVNEDDLEGRVCYGGLDLSSTTDITAFVLVFPPTDEDDKYAILPYFWVPEDTLDLRVRRDHVPYDVWERQGFLQTTEGNVVHYGYIEKFIERLGERFNIREIAFDRWGAVQMVQNLENMGFTVVPFGQGFKDMSPPTKELMKLTLEEKLAHGGHPVLRWMMDNIYIRTDPAGNIKADKEKSTEKIDGAIATIMGLDRAIRCGNDTGASVYDNRGILFI